ncbi:uncharacterized protein LOC128502611 isoform X2 [Spea bombifrons]|uniref:uncharacterized protein LOC128502611 isoform X2 n=1 Tax=Spea bombifrons TaxID=233779 RepID=UPI00234B4987|nr:uncharacterized protein LOC128502611 isoform X2 [Spea bombifrons]
MLHVFNPLRKSGSDMCLSPDNPQHWKRLAIRRAAPTTCPVSSASPTSAFPVPEVRVERSLSAGNLACDSEEEEGGDGGALGVPRSVWRTRSESHLDTGGGEVPLGAKEMSSSGWSLPSPKTLRKKRRAARVATAKQNLLSFFVGSFKSLASSVETDIGSVCEADRGHRSKKKESTRKVTCLFSASGRYIHLTLGDQVQKKSKAGGSLSTTYFLTHTGALCFACSCSRSSARRIWISGSPAKIIGILTPTLSYRAAHARSISTTSCLNPPKR